MQVGRYPPIVARRISCVQVAATWDMQRVPLSHKHQTRVPIRPVKPLWDVAAEPTHLQRTPNSAPLIPSNGCPIPFPTRSPRQTTSDLVARSRRPIRVQKASGRNESRSHPRVSSPPPFREWQKWQRCQRLSPPELLPERGPGFVSRPIRARSVRTTIFSPHKMFRFKVRRYRSSCTASEPLNPPAPRQPPSANPGWVRIRAGEHRRQRRSPPSSLGCSAAFQALIPASCEWQATPSLPLSVSLQGRDRASGTRFFASVTWFLSVSECRHGRRLSVGTKI